MGALDASLSLAATTTIGLPRALRPADEPPDIPDYRFIKVIGRGAFGKVWLAEEPLAGVFRAIKILDCGGRMRKSQAQLTNLELEGLHAYQTPMKGHPHLIQISKTGLCQHPVSDQWPADRDQASHERDSAPSRTTDRQPPATAVYYVMEIADHARGAQPHRPQDYEPLTLAALLRQKGRLPSLDAVQNALHLLDAIAHLHKAGIQHRDIKPSNILLVGGVIKLADVGLVGDSGDASIGTSGYLPPEGKPEDLYAFGKVLYEMVTGLPASAFPEWPGDLVGFPPLAKGKSRAGSSSVADPLLSRLRTLTNRLCHPGAGVRLTDLHACRFELTDMANPSRAPTVSRRRVATIIAATLVMGGLSGAFSAQWRHNHLDPRNWRSARPPFDGSADFDHRYERTHCYRMRRYHSPGREYLVERLVRDVSVRFFDIQTRLEDKGVHILSQYTIICETNPPSDVVERNGGHFVQLFIAAGDHRVLVYHGQPAGDLGAHGRIDKLIRYEDVKLHDKNGCVAIHLAAMLAATPDEAQRSLQDEIGKAAIGDIGIVIAELSRIHRTQCIDADRHTL